MSRLIPGACALIAGAAFVSLWAEVSTPDAGESTPERAAAQLLEASSRRDWDRYAELTDPNELKSFRDALAPLIEGVAKKPAEEQTHVLSLFAGGTDVNTVLAWTPREFFARFLKGVGSLEPLKSALGGVESQIIGIVREGTDDAHAVVRSRRKLLTRKIEKVDVLSFHKSNEGWKLRLPSEYQALAETIRLSHDGTRTETSTATDTAEPEVP